MHVFIYNDGALIYIYIYHIDNIQYLSRIRESSKKKR